MSKNLTIGDEISVVVHDAYGTKYSNGVVVSISKDNGSTVVALKDTKPIPGKYLQYNDEFLSPKPKGVAKVSKEFGLNNKNKIYITVPAKSAIVKIDKVIKKNPVKPLSATTLKVGMKVRCLYPNSSNYGREAVIAKITNDGFEVDWATGDNSYGRKWTRPENFEPAVNSKVTESVPEAPEIEEEESVSDESVDDIDSSLSSLGDIDSDNEMSHIIPPSKLKFGDKVKLHLSDSGYTSTRIDATFLSSSGDGGYFHIENPISIGDIESFSIDYLTENGMLSDKDLAAINKSAKKLKLDTSKELFVEILDTDSYCEIEEIYKGDTKKMSSDKTIMEIVKADFEKAGYRVASTQLTNGVKAGLLAMFKDKGMDDGKLGVLKELLETEFGNAFISTALGYGLTYAPTISEDPRVQRLAGEFRVQGMAIIGNEVVGAAVQYLMPALNNALSALPAATAETTSKQRVEVSMPQSKTEDGGIDVEVEEEQEETVGKTAAA